LQAAKDIALSIDAIEHIIFDINIDRFGGSSLFKKTSNHIPNTHDVSSIGQKIPSTYVPARNTIFLSIALSYAETRKADEIYIGVTSADYSGYPDCRPEYIQAFQTLANIATKRAVLGNPISLKTPLLHLNKKEIIQRGQELSVPFEKTWSCYQGEKKACGHCESCFLRLKGFKDAGISDPLPYQTLPTWYEI
jgi:7-cyano-7-deazaguanine synthase